MKTHAHHLLLAAALLACATANADVLLSSTFTGSTANTTSKTFDNIVWDTQALNFTGNSTVDIPLLGTGGNVTTADTEDRIGAQFSTAGSTWTSIFTININLANALDTVTFTTIDLTQILTVSSGSGAPNGNTRSVKIAARLLDSTNTTVLASSDQITKSIVGNTSAYVFTPYTMTFGSGSGYTLNASTLGGQSGSVKVAVDITAMTNASMSKYDDLTINGTYNATTAIPEPSTYGLMGAGAVIAAAVIRRRRKVA